MPDDYLKLALPGSAPLVHSFAWLHLREACLVASCNTGLLVFLILAAHLTAPIALSAAEYNRSPIATFHSLFSAALLIKPSKPVIWIYLRWHGYRLGSGKDR